MDGGFPSRSQRREFAIAVLDVDDNAPQFTVSVTELSVGHEEV